MTTLQNLLECLEHTCEAHSEMLKIAENKRKVLIEGDIATLQSLTIPESTLIEKIQSLDALREQLVREYLNEKQIPESELAYTLDDVLVGDDHAFIKKRISQTAKKLREIIGELSRLNEDNQQLIQTSLSYLQYSIGLFARKEQAVGYGPNAVNRYSNLLDAKI